MTSTGSWPGGGGRCPILAAEVAAPLPAPTPSGRKHCDHPRLSFEVHPRTAATLGGPTISSRASGNRPPWASRYLPHGRRGADLLIHTTGRLRSGTMSSRSWPTHTAFAPDLLGRSVSTRHLAGRLRGQSPLIVLATGGRPWSLPRWAASPCSSPTRSRAPERLVLVDSGGRRAPRSTCRCGPPAARPEPCCPSSPTHASTRWARRSVRRSAAWTELGHDLAEMTRGYAC